MTLVVGRESPVADELLDELPLVEPSLVPPDVPPPAAAPAGSAKYPFTMTVTVNISDAGSLNCRRREAVLSPGESC